jgi:four helix bundle suffix protein
MVQGGGLGNCCNGYKGYNSYNMPGGYRSLAFFIQSSIIYDFTVQFVKRYIGKGSRTADQMIQAARSGKQNIAEGYLQKSFENKLKLISVSRASLEELLNDYCDFLRQKNLKLWDKNSPLSQRVRRLAYQDNKSYQTYEKYLLNPESAANAMICLINQTNKLLDQKIRWLEEDFVKQGGFRENLFRKRREYLAKRR